MTDRGKAFVMLNPLSCQVAKEIYWGEGRRKAPEDRVAAKVFESLSAEADWMLDVGAYTGFFALLTCAVNPVAKVIAFEIVPENYLLLLKNILRNDLVGRIDARLLGLGASGDSMLVPEKFISSELPTSISRQFESKTGVKIPFSSLDEISGGISGTVLMKVDVEGTEDILFEHGRSFLAKHRPHILCEVLTGSTTAPQLTRQFKDLGYSFYKIVADGLEQHDEIHPDRHFKDWYFSTEQVDSFLRRAR